MRFVGIFLLIFCELAAFADGDPANIFDCKGQNISVSFTTTSLAGVPTFLAKINTDTAARFSGTQIKTQEVTVGSLIGVEVQPVVNGRPGEKLSLVLPHVTFNDTRMSATFSTFLFRTAIIAPAKNARPNVLVAETNQVLPLECTAQIVTF